MYMNLGQFLELSVAMKIRNTQRLLCGVQEIALTYLARCLAHSGAEATASSSSLITAFLRTLTGAR